MRIGGRVFRGTRAIGPATVDSPPFNLFWLSSIAPHLLFSAMVRVPDLWRGAQGEKYL